MKLLSILGVLILSIAGFSMEMDPMEKDLNKITIKESDKIHMIYQGEAAFLHPSSLYDFLVTTNCWPCEGLVFSFNDEHLMIHKDATIDLDSIIELLETMGVNKEKISEVKVVIFSRKMDEDTYTKRRNDEEYNGLSQKEEALRVKNFLINNGVKAESINVAITTSTDNTLVLDKKGEVFQASQFNDCFFCVGGLNNLGNSIFTVKKITEIGQYFHNESSIRFNEAFPVLEGNSEGRLQLKPFMHKLDAPLKWPNYTGNICNIKNCHRIAKSKCSACKVVYYCSGICQKKDWQSHKLTCNKK